MVEAAEDIPSTPTRGGGCDQGRPRSTGTTKQPPCSRFVPCLVCRNVVSNRVGACSGNTSVLGTSPRIGGNLHD